MNIQEKLLTVNPYSRPGTKIGTIKKIVVHWVGNANSTAIANRNYFESLKEKKDFASSQYIIGLQGEVIRCVPENEVAYHAKEANSYSIGIECCHPDWEGKFNSATYAALIELCVDLCKRYKLNPLTDIIRHHDVTGKDCPHYYVANIRAWEQLKKDVNSKINIVDTDTDLIKAVDRIIDKGININATAWNSMGKINLKNVPVLLGKLGGIDKLIKDGIISNRLLWDSGEYNANHVKALIIKYASKLA